MFRSKKGLRLLAVFGLAGALIGATAGRVAAGGEEEAADLNIDYDVATSAYTIEPTEPGTPLFERVMQPFGGLFYNDTGFDIAPGIESGGYPGRNIRQSTIRQVFASAGLTGIYQYNGATNVFGPVSETDFRWILAEDKPPALPQALQEEGDPFFFHQHFDFFAPTVGTYFFDFRLTNTVLVDGTAVPDSPVYRITYTAVPEPGTLSLLALAAVPGMAVARRLRRAA